MSNLFKPEVTSRKIGYTRSSRKVFEAKLLGHESDWCQSKEEASINLAQKIEGYTGSYTPEVIAWDKQHAMLVYRDGNYGWAWCYLCDHEGFRSTAITTRGNGDDKQTAVEHAKYALAKMIWRFEMGQDHPMYSILGQDLDNAWLTAEQQSELRRWIDFQTRYHIAIQHGFSDVDAHHYAGRFPGRPELLAKELSPIE